MHKDAVWFLPGADEGHSDHAAGQHGPQLPASPVSLLASAASPATSGSSSAPLRPGAFVGGELQEFRVQLVESGLELFGQVGTLQFLEASEQHFCRVHGGDVETIAAGG